MIKCAACHNEMKQKNGDIDLRIGKQLYFVRNVSYDECSVCGEKVLSSEISQALYDKIKKRDFVEETVKIPVLDGTYG